MDEHYRAFFGFVREPFATDISYAEILKTPELESVKVRFDYIMRLGAIGVVTGEVGSGKSTAVRYALNTLHPSEYRSLYITASSGWKIRSKPAPHSAGRQHPIPEHASR